MARVEKKYEVLPGVAIPDLKAILSAASDFSSEGVEGVELNTNHHPSVKNEPKMQAATGEDIDRLRALGEAVAEEEVRAAAESKRRMEAIKGAVETPLSLSDLRKANAEQEMSEERREEIKKIDAEQAAKAAEEEAKAKAREERRLQQQKALEESLARKAAKAEEEARILAEKQAKLDEIEKARKAQERLEAKKKAQEEAAKRAAEAKEAGPDDEYLAWVKAKREAAIAEAAEKKALEEAKKAEAKPEVKEEAPAAVVETPVAETPVVETPAPEEKAEEVIVEAVPVIPNTNSDDSTLDDFGEFL